MPKILSDYSKGLIYKIVCIDLTITELYVGSTTNFIQRKASHKSKCNSNSELKIYQIINANGGWDNWLMLEIEKFSCIDNNELRTRERYWFETLNAQLNMMKPIKTKDEKLDDTKIWRDNNKEHIKEYNKNHKVIYYANNKVTLIEKVKIYYDANREARLKYAKEYRDTHKEAITLTKKKWADNKKGNQV